MRTWAFLLLFLWTVAANVGLAAGSSVNINTADVAELSALDGIGQSKAEAIVAFREENGPFTHIDELVKVSGIGLATLERNRERLSVEPAVASSQQP
jgi:competence protein ComEA